MKPRWWLVRGLGGVAATLAIVLLFSTCKKPDEQNAIAGKVSVTGGSNAGVRVDLYAAPSFAPASVWTTTGSHTSSGFRYSPQAVFEWRTAGTSLQASVTTGSDGSFNIPNLPTGPYIVIASKDSFGWSPPLSANLSGSKADVGTIRLRHDNYVPSNSLLQTDTVWSSGQHYVLPGNLTIAAGATLTIEPGAVVRIGEAGGKIIVYGTLRCEGTPDSYIVFTSNQSPPAAGDWQFISFLPGASPPVFRYCAFRYGDQAIRSEVAGGRIENCCFTDFTAQGADLTGGSATADSVVIRHNVVDHIQSGFRVHVLPDVQDASNIAVDHNAVFGCAKFGVECERFRGGSVYCNYFFNCGRDSSQSGSGQTGALRIADARNLDVTQNEFNNCTWGTYFESRVDSSVHVHHNHFFRLGYCMYVYFTANFGAYPTFPTFHLNCIQSSSGFVYVDICQYNTHTIDCDSNYWGGIQGNSLAVRMHDCHDNRGPRILYPTILPACPADAALCNN